MAIIFSEGSGVADSVFGKSQAPIRMFLEARGEAFEAESALKYVYNMGTSENYGDMYTSMTGMEDFEPVGENGNYPSGSIQEGFKKNIIYETWKNSFTLSQEIIEDGKLMDLKRKPTAFITSYHRTREKFGAALYAGALLGKTEVNFKGKSFDTTSADKLCLFSKAHPSAVEKNKTQTNLYADEFSAAVLDAAESAMHTVRDDKGEILDVAPDTILIPDNPVLKRKVLEVIGSDQDPATANNAYNHQYGRWNLIIWPYLNQYLTPGKNPWMLMDSKYMEAYGAAVFNDRIPLTVRSVIADNDANKWLGRARYNAGFTDWRYICAGGVSGGTQLIT